MAEKTSIHIPDRIRRIIGATGDGARSLSGRIADIIDRYGEIVARHRPALLETYTDAELRAIADATKGTVWDPAATIHQGIAADVAGADGLDTKWGVDQTYLVRRLAALSFEQSVALLELVAERAWNGTTK